MSEELNKKSKLTKKQLESVAVYATRAIEKMAHEIAAGLNDQGERIDPELYSIFRKLDGHIANINRLIDGETLDDLMKVNTNDVD